MVRPMSLVSLSEVIECVAYHIVRQGFDQIRMYSDGEKHSTALLPTAQLRLLIGNCPRGMSFGTNGHRYTPASTIIVASQTGWPSLTLTSTFSHFQRIARRWLPTWCSICMLQVHWVLWLGVYVFRRPTCSS